jgi:hypothetical protein
MNLISPATHGRHEKHDLVIEIGHWRPALKRAGQLFIETVAIPTALMFLFLNTLGLVAGLSAVLGWCVLTVATRWIRGRHMPGTLLVCVGSLCARATIALILSSAFAYLLQPVIGSLFMAALFMGSAIAGRPITARLAKDFVALPQALIHHRGMQRMFTQVAFLWGAGRLIDAGMSVGFLHFGIGFGLLSRGVFSGLLTVLTIACCAAWGRRCVRRLGVTLRFGAAAATAA